MITIEKFSRQAQNVVACFLLQEKRSLMAESKTIYCPKCGRKVAIWDGRSTNNISVKCKKCNKLVVYDVENVIKVRTGDEGYDALQDVE